jgi:AraC-like DNA-binding protein
MRIATFSPSAALAPFVARYTIVETEAYEETRALLPELGLVAGVRFAGGAHLRGVRMPDVSLAGVQGSVRQMTTLPHSGVILAQFVAGGAAAFFDLTLHELAGTAIEVDLDRERICAAADHAERVAIFEALLRARWRDRRDHLVEAALAAILEARGDLRIADLAKRLATAQDPLEKRFRRIVGASPKQVATLARIRHAIALGQERGATWAQAAHAAGYFDQAHFNREFRAVTGEPPSTFFRATAYC